MLALSEIAPYIKTAYFVIVCAMIIEGLALLAMQNCKSALWLHSKDKISLGLSAVGSLFFMLGLQPYAAIFTFVFLIVKSLMLIKWA